MVEQKRRRREGTDTDQGEVKALRQENEELREERARSREENEGLKLRIAKLGAESQTPQEEEKEVRLPTEVWAIIAGKLNENDVCPFALVSKQLREAQVLAGRKLVTRPFNFTLSPLSSDVSDDDDDDDDDYEGGGRVGYPWSVDDRATVKVMSIYRFHPVDIKQYENTYGVFLVSYFTEGWCAYWSRKFNEDHTDPKIVKRVLYVAARHGYLQVFEKYWSQGPKKRLSKLWDDQTCCFAAFHGHLELVKWLRAKGCPWGISMSLMAALGGHLEVLQWIRGQDPPCPWDSGVCYHAASKGHLEVLRWARSQGCPWDGGVSCAAAQGGQLEVLQWMRAQDPPCPWNSNVCFDAALHGHLDVLRWARSQGCPWDDKVPVAAAKHGHLEVLKWLIKEGCPFSKRLCREAAADGGERARKVLEWLDE
ncbi:putative ankyrin repeat protein [Chloropicon roscoffensis]|uniref:Ankyrin repeat protein n=1 Tax=Chloropicon roscoffensis TaxID=1461544 RepID=A0AAX4P3V1_9CHLO